MLTVLKFGGSSLADAGRLRRAADIIAQTRTEGSDAVAVLSARGDTTDELLRSALELSPLPPPRELDALLSTGEAQSTALMSILLDELGVPAVSMSGAQAGILTDSRHGDADIFGIDTARIRSELSRGGVAVVAGFQGCDHAGDVTTLGRGGSDTTAIALAAALNADRCEIYSDYDGIYTADPRLVTGAKKLSAIDYRDMLLLAKGGSQVLHSKAVETAMRHGIEVRLLSSFVHGEGTVMKTLRERPPLCGVTRDSRENTVSLVAASADIELLAEMADALQSEGIAVLRAEVTDSVCAVTVPPELLLPGLQLVHAHFFALPFLPR